MECRRRAILGKSGGTPEAPATEVEEECTSAGCVEERREEKESGRAGESANAGGKTEGSGRTTAEFFFSVVGRPTTAVGSSASPSGSCGVCSVVIKEKSERVVGENIAETKEEKERGPRWREALGGRSSTDGGIPAWSFSRLCG